MKNLFTFLFVTLIGVTGLFAQAPDAGDATYVANWKTPLPSWFAALPTVVPTRKQASATPIASIDPKTCVFDTEWAKIPGTGNSIANQLGNNASATGPTDFKDAAFKVVFDASNIYILLQYFDDDVTGSETVEVAWAPYLKINAPDLASLPQAWYARYIQFGAYKATFKKTGFDAAMMIDGSVTDGNTAINWGGTNSYLTGNLFLDDRTVVGSHTVKQIITIGFTALTGEARPDFNQTIWSKLNAGQGISFDMKVNDVDGNDALNTAVPAVKTPAEYWWNTTNNDCYALTTYAGFLSAPAIDPTAGDAAYVANWKTPLPSWFAALPAVEPTRKQATATPIASLDPKTCVFDTEWAKIPGTGNSIANQLGNNASATGPNDFKDAAFKALFDGSNIYILLQYYDDDVTGLETVEVAWAPYLTINAPALTSLPQAWYARYIQFGAYKATFKKTGFDAAMMIDGSVTDGNTAINWGGTNSILTGNLYLDDRTVVGSHTVKQIITISYTVLTGEARPQFNDDIWSGLNGGKGISFDMKVNDVDGNDALNTAVPAVKTPAEYWWNTTNNDCYALTTYAGFLKNGTTTGISSIRTETSSIFGYVSNYQVHLAKNVNVTIYNILGSVVKTMNNVNIVDLSEMKTGIYIIRAGNEAKKFLR